MAEPTSSAAASLQVSTEEVNVGDILAGEQIFLVEEHFPAPVAELLVQLIQQLGASTVVARSDATILLVNPRSPFAAKEAEHAAFLAKSYPDLPQPLTYPYHWLNHCLHTRRRVESPAAPVIFVHPDRSRDHAPLKVWVSVNLHRHTGESAQTAQAETIRKVELHGGLKVTKRSQADLLIVDPESQFYRTQIMPERVKAGRAAWQKVGEREWVEACIRDGVLEWRTIQETEEDNEVDSMAEDDPIPEGKGPGRPTGKPRVDYSPEDDDFLCRYLAHYHPKGSWHSRKTYETMVTMVDTYPMVARHSNQSWHERFKKNATAFSSRVLRLKEQGLDDTLKTQAERQKELERRRKQIEKTVQQSTGAEAGPSNGATQPAVAQQNGSTPDRSKGKARLVEDSLSQEQLALRPETTEQIAVAQPAVEAQQPSAATVEVEASAVSGNTEQAAIAVVVETVADGVQQRPETSLAEPGVELQQRSTANVAEPTEPFAEAQQPPIAAPAEPPVEVQQPPTAAVAETAVEAQQSSATAIEAEASTVSTTAEQAAVAVVVEPVVEPVPASVMIAQETVLEILAAPETQDVAEVDATQAATADQTETQRILAAFAQPGSSKRARETTPPTQPHRKVESALGAAEPEKASTHTSTPTPKRKKPRLSTMAEELSASARRRSEVRSPPRHPDQVLAFTREPIPNAPRQAPEPFTRTPEKRKTPEPPLSREQFAQELEKGREIALKAKELYRKRIMEYCQKYKVKPLDLVRVLDEMPKNLRRSSGGGGETYWSDVQRTLEAHFGF